jgi:Fe-S oxidoreductase
MRSNGGYALDRLCKADPLNVATLICGSEGTLALVVGATLNLVPLPRHAGLLVLHFRSVFDALGATPLILKHRPAAVELVDGNILSAGIPELPEATRRKFLVDEPAAILIAELYDDNPEVLEQRLSALDADLADASIGYARVSVLDTATQTAVWNLRNRGFGLLMSRPGDRQPHEFIEDAAVDPAHLRDYIEQLSAMLAEEGVPDVAYYAHASVGVIHVRPVLNLKDPADVKRMGRVADRASDLVLKFGGAFTGEHGDGLVRSCWLEKMYGPRIAQAFREIKRAFDADGVFNPHKIVDALPMTENLRYGGGFHYMSVKTYFDYGPYGGMGGMAGMCSGVGQCRQKLVGTMCPSYMATLDEQHTTRARANALRVALSNRGLLDGLDDPALIDVMDLCLSCKACKTECPTGVDMARLKAEWLAARNHRHGVSRSARFIADAPRLARRGAWLPRTANFWLRQGWVRKLLERRYGLDHRIAPPRLAMRTFRHWFKRHPRRNDAPRGRVVYFVDTWTNYYWPQVGIAAVKLLEAAGFEVVAPRLQCCGRPLISKGLLAEARELAVSNVESLCRFVDAGCYVVGSEPSCILTLLDEYPHFVRNADAKALAARVMTVESLLARVLRAEPGAIAFTPRCHAGEVVDPPRRPPAEPLVVRYHGHCHLKAQVGTADVNELLRAVPGLIASEINSGCCGMAGSFGHEAAHYDVARAIGEQRLFPAVRARGDAVVAINGFSCREQIAHHTGVMPRHVLEILAEALPDDS